MLEWPQTSQSLGLRTHKIGPAVVQFSGPLYSVRYKWEKRTLSTYGLKRYSTLADRVVMDRSMGEAWGLDLDDGRCGLEYLRSWLSGFELRSLHRLLRRRARRRAQSSECHRPDRILLASRNSKPAKRRRMRRRKGTR